jgi:hypothetical protein
MLERVDAGLADLAQIEMSAKMEGRNMTSIYVPDKTKVKEFQRKQEIEKKKTEEEEKTADAAADKNQPHAEGNPPVAE